ncbi:bifunctional diaminohydroxyphosphoribosylaminopyrimidine deaminase/5-amino-6-(5-phosphoribosylamino)uracil reductase RibD [Corynebacterium stercoris]|uniref:bifunctional diaminohydroxyphosphoribosylaminopyrimidine deaminase/5-amino-6-(5-phosphoribosylamino)uracil reductase RibD n=1 Tax=Corynebacterium stercoris TaxID=2943490 RepID=UPI003F5A50E7
MSAPLDAAVLATAASAAILAGESVRGRTSPNPPVGCALVDASGELIATGATEPAGGAHAEAVALREAGERARGATAVVTLEPCNHTGRTGPCSHALVEAGVGEVVYLTADPNPLAAGGADFLREHGVAVQHMPIRVGALQPWLHAVRRGRPCVTWKFAATLDGFTAAADGTSQWITGAESRELVHEDRATRDAIIVGTGTALADDPSLTARHPDGSLYAHQPRRVVVGSRAVPTGTNLDRLGYEQYATPEEALAALWESGARDVLLEGGAGLAQSFLSAGLVDMVQAYLAPALLGAGRGVLGGPVAATLAEAHRFTRTLVRPVGDDVLIELERSD